jgi:hypothetical protein
MLSRGSATTSPDSGLQSSARVRRASARRAAIQHLQHPSRQGGQLLESNRSPRGPPRRPVSSLSRERDGGEGLVPLLCVSACTRPEVAPCRRCRPAGAGGRGRAAPTLRADGATHRYFQHPLAVGAARRCRASPDRTRSPAGGSSIRRATVRSPVTSAPARDSRAAIVTPRSYSTGTRSAGSSSPRQTCRFAASNAPCRRACRTRRR